MQDALRSRLTGSARVHRQPASQVPGLAQLRLNSLVTVGFHSMRVTELIEAREVLVLMNSFASEINGLPFPSLY